MDWKDALQSIAESLPDFPVGPDAQPQAPAKPAQGRLDIQLDRKGRAGKQATIVSGFTIPDDEVAEVAAKLKQQLGCGGSARGGEILIQGDKRQQVLDALTRMHFKARII